MPLGLTGTPVLSMQPETIYPKSEPAHGGWPPKVVIAAVYCNAGRSGRFLNWMRSTMNVDWQYSGGLKMLLGGVGQNWLCGVIAKGPWKDGKVEGAGGFETELLMGEVGEQGDG